MESQVGGDTTVSVASPPTPSSESSTPALPSDGGGSATPSSGTTQQSPVTTTVPEQLPPETSAWYGRFTKLNERAKSAEARVRSLEDTYGDLLQLPATHGRALTGIMREIAQNPVGATARLVGELIQHPTLGPQMAAAVARWQATHSAAPQSAPPQVSLDPDLAAENGEGVYSAKRLQQILLAQQQALEARVAQRLSPLEQMAQQSRQQAQLAALERQADGVASQQLDVARSWHGFTDHEGEIAQLMAEHPPNHATRDPGWSLQDAYLYVLHTKILPTLPAQAQAAVVANLQQKAAAATMNPSTSPMARPGRLRGDSIEDWVKALEGAASR